MQCKPTEPTENLSKAPAFRVKSNWNLAKHPAVEIFLSKLETEISSVLPGTTLKYNISKEEWLTMRGLTEARDITIKRADKGSCVVVWDREDQIAEADKQFKDNETYDESSSFKDVDLVKLVQQSNSIYQSLRKRKVITKEELKYFTYEYKKAINFWKMYLLPKIHKRLVNAPSQPVILNCGMPTEKASEFLDHDLQPIMKSGTSTLRTLMNFCRNLKT